MISRIVASRNQGNCSYGTNSSRPSNRSQNPLGVTFVTSTSEVIFPCSADFILVFPHESERGGYLSNGEAIIVREDQLRF